jgi:gliding motility-associated-like protein
MDSMLYYNVYRVIDTNVYPIPIAELSPDELSYSDYYDNAVSPTSKVGYFVEAVGYFNDSIAQADTARSNTNFLAKVTNVFLPSGFKPKGGVNNIFKPIYTGIKSTNYSFKILNRWGMMIYESNQPLLGWNGKYDGEFVTPGAYVYVVDYETIYGKKIRKSGVFYVLY